MIRAVLFDLDGTLADTAPDMARTVNVMREPSPELGAPVEQPDVSSLQAVGVPGQLPWNT